MSLSKSTLCLRWGRSAYEKDEDLTLEQQALAQLGVDVRHDASLTPDWEGVAIVVVHSKKQVTRKVMQQAPDLKLIITTTSGYDHIDVRAASELGILVARSPLARRDAVIETTLAMGLSLLRELPYFQEQAHAGRWARRDLPQRPISLVSNLRVGIIGYGVIGQKAVDVWKMLGAEVNWTDPAYASSTPLEELLQNSQLITLHCALNTSTENIISDTTLQMMSPGSILLNTARGRCVDIDAVLNASHLGGVGLDVFPEEPCPHLQELARQKNFWIAPHAAGYHQTLGQSVTEEVVETVRMWLQKRPLPHEVTPHSKSAKR